MTDLLEHQEGVELLASNLLGVLPPVEEWCGVCGYNSGLDVSIMGTFSLVTVTNMLEVTNLLEVCGDSGDSDDGDCGDCGDSSASYLVMVEKARTGSSTILWRSRQCSWEGQRSTGDSQMIH